MHELDGHDALRRLRLPFGGDDSTLVVGPWAVRLSGLDESLAAELGRRWGPFLADAPPADARRTVRIAFADGGDRTWLPDPAPGETYRVEARVEDGRPLLRSYHFLTGPDVDAPAGDWRALVTRTTSEPPGRVIENVVRMRLARLVVEDGGVPFHGAGVVRDGRAHLLVGPSGAGKTTAVRLSRPCVSLGDDFALAVPDGERWATAAVPFDNAETSVEEPPRGLLPLAGIWRLHQAAETRLETPAAMVRSLSVLACAAAPWTMPDLSAALVDNVERLVGEVPYGHVHFDLSSTFWDRIDPV
jgi:hypothetical protein